MRDEDDELLLDENLDDKNKNITPSGDNEDLDQDDEGTGDDDDQNQDDDGGERKTRQERRHERYEQFNAARRGFEETGTQREQVLRRDQYSPLKYDRDAEYDVDALEKDRRQFGDDRFAQGIEQQRFYDQQERYYDRLETDSDFVASKYPFLDEDSDDFDPDLNKTINELFFKAAGYDQKTHLFKNTGIRYKTFVQEQVKVMERYASVRNADSATNLETQRGRTGVRPSGGARKPAVAYDGDPSSMSDEQLDAQLAAMGLSSKKRRR